MSVPRQYMEDRNPSLAIRLETFPCTINWKTGITKRLKRDRTYATNLIEVELFIKGIRGGVIAVDKDGNIVMLFNTEGMVHGTASNDLVPTVKVY